MKKFYLLLLTFSLSFLSFSQSPIATYGRDNALSPTNTGTAANISAIGFTRGAGINSGGGTNFTSRAYNNNSQVTAQAADEYIQWSISANASYTIDLSSLDIRINRNNNGPQNWQIFYSLDGFTTVGLPFSTVRTANIAETDYNITSPVINSGNGGTVTFRLYAWNANTPGGTFTIAGQTSWAAFGVTLPGARVSGTINTVALNSSESVIETTLFDPTQNFSYLPYTTPSGLTTTNALKIGEFIIKDGGADMSDLDLLATTLTDLTFDVAGSTNLAALAIINSGVNVSEVTTVTPTTIFNSINAGAGIVTSDNGSNIFSIYATFKTTVTDNDQLQLTIIDAVANGIIGSSFAQSDAGGASTNASLDYNRIEVIASEINFGIQPSDVNVFTVMVPAPTITTDDVNGNIDLDNNGEILISAGTANFAASSTLSVFAVNGVATYDNLIFTSTNTNEVLLAVSLDGLGFAFSNTFDVLGYIITIAHQDFDGATPDWPYTSDIPFFDNGWGTDGYYGLINIVDASPIDYASLSENILGSHDLNDEGNGTAGLATVTFDTIDISAYTNVSLTFDYDITGYAANDDAQYEMFFDGVSQGVVDLIGTASDAEGTVDIAIPDTVNTISLQVSVGSNGNTTFTAFDNFKLESVFDGLIYFDTAWSPNAPNNTTGNLNAIVINGTYSVSGPTSIDNLIITDAGNLFIESGESLQVNGELMCNDNVILNSTSQSYASLIVEGSVSGDITYSRHINTNAAVGGNDLISAPATGQTFGELASNNSNMFSNPLNTTEKLFGPFDKVTGLYLTYDTAIPAEAAVVLEPGIGYRAASTDGLNFDFNGFVTTGTVNVPIVIAGPNNPEWNLIGNPYTSYISLSGFLAQNNSQLDPVRSGVYGYDGDASDGWEIWNQAYSDANPDARMTPGQGFLVASALANNTITFLPAMREFGNSDDFIPGRMQNPNISNLELTMVGSSKSYKTDFYFTDNASLGLDPGYDSETFGGTTPQFSLYSHLVSENTGNTMAIQSMSSADLADVTVPLGVNISQGQQATITISASTLPASSEVYLEDTVTNIFTLLNDSDYTFTAATNLSGTGRFFLRFSEQSLSVADNDINNLVIYATANPKALHVNGNLSENSKLNLYDIQGRLILESRLDNNSNVIDVSHVKTGVYIVSITDKHQTKSQKIIIK